MSARDLRKTTKLNFRKDLNWVSLPHGFPFGEWDDPQDWAENMAAMVYYIGRGQFDDSRPTVDWFIWARRIIGDTWRSFASARNRYKCVLSHDIDAIPAYISVDTFLGDLPSRGLRRRTST